MYILGLTGPIASGKSTVTKLLERENIPFIDADDIVHDCYTKNTPVFIELVDLFGSKIICAKTGNIDRKQLVKLIKENAENITKIESIVYPQLRIVMKFKLSHAYSRTSKIAVIVVPLMFENNFNELCDSVVVCSCSFENRHRRFMEREDATEDKWQFITNKQMAIDEYIERSDFIINTNCSILETEHKTIEIINKLTGESGNVWHDKWRDIG